MFLSTIHAKICEAKLMKITELTPPKEFIPIHLSILIETKAELEDLLARLNLTGKDVNSHDYTHAWKSDDTSTADLLVELKTIWLTRCHNS